MQHLDGCLLNKDMYNLCAVWTCVIVDLSYKTLVFKNQRGLQDNTGNCCSDSGSPISLPDFKASRQCIGCLEYWHIGDERMALQLRPVGFRLREASPPFPFLFFFQKYAFLNFI